MNTVIELLSEQKFDFSGLPASAQPLYTMVRGIDVTAYRTGTLIARVHERAMSGSQVLFVDIGQEAPSPDDPAVEFLGSTLASIVSPATDPAPKLYLDNLNGPIPSHVYLSISGRQHTVASTPFVVTVSVSLLLRSERDS